MGLKDRPYVGTWSANRKKVVRYTPDCLVFVNGDTAMHSTGLKRQKLDLQPYITQVSVDHGTQAGTASASISLSIPHHVGSALFREGNTMLTTGLEIHIYMRGYFDVTGVVQLDSGHPDYQEVLDNLPELGTMDTTKTSAANRPHYHCFHGVTTNATHEYSGGFYTAGLECTGMLHFWQYMDMSTNASLFGARPSGSQLRMSLVGHNYTDMSPFAIIYSLYKDTAGAAGAVAFALSSSGNVQNPTRAGETSLFHQTQRYWERRFTQSMYRLRMFGVDGTMFNSTTQAMIGRMSNSQIQSAISNDLTTYAGGAAGNSTDPLRFWDGTGTTTEVRNARIRQDLMDSVGGTRVSDVAIESDHILFARRTSERSSMGVAVHQLKAYVKDISAYGSVNLFESSYESKLDIALAAANACGYEFYQDVDGDLVFKPPLYNMNTNHDTASTAYSVDPVDVISISYQENEPEATYMTCKSEAFSNTNGVGLSGEWGVRGQFIDYQLVAKFGWRPGDFELAFYNDGRAAFWGAVAKLAIVNKSMNTASLTIPLRPELRCGYPIYIRHIDSYYYIDNMSHSFSFGGQCTTTLQLVARRRKWLPPGDGNASGIDCVKLDRPDLEPVSLREAVRVGPGKTEVMHVREVGFPNVVMALDMTSINPLSWALGVDAFDLGNTYHLNMMLYHLLGKGLISYPQGTGVDASNPATWRSISFVQWDTSITLGTRTITERSVNIEDLYAQAESYSSAAQGLDERVQAAYAGGGVPDDDLRAEVEEFQSSLIAQWIEQDDAIATGTQTDTDGDGTADTYTSGSLTIFDLLMYVQNTLESPGGNADAAFASQTSADILNILGDRKASFTNATTPGFYRYYSSAHPSSDHQAPKTMRFSPRTGSNSSLVPQYDQEQISDYNETPQNRVLFYASLEGLDWSSITTDEDQLQNLQKGCIQRNIQAMGEGCKGFLIMPGRSDPTDPVLPTHEIMRLEFAKTPLAYNMLAPRSRRVPAFSMENFESDFVTQIKRFMTLANAESELHLTLSEFFDLIDVIYTPEMDPYPGTGADQRPGAATVHTHHDKFFNIQLTKPMEALWTRNQRTLQTEEGRSWRGYRATRQAADSDFSGNNPEIRPWGRAYTLTMEKNWSETSRIDQRTRTFYVHRSMTNSALRFDRVVKNQWNDGSNPARYPDATWDWEQGDPVLELAGSGRGDIGAVQLRYLPLVCSAFANSSCYDGTVPRMSRGSVGYDPTKIKLDGIKTKLAEMLASSMKTRLNKIFGQLRSAFYNYYPAAQQGRNPLASSEAVRAYYAMNDFVESLNNAMGTNISLGSGDNSMYRSTIPGVNGTFVTSPVFPISDDEGYEHFGNFAYGRGVKTIDQLERLHNQDPVAWLGTIDEAIAEDMEGQMIQFAESLMQEGLSQDARYTRLAELANVIKSLPSEQLSIFLQHRSIGVDWTGYQNLSSDRVENLGGTGEGGQPDPIWVDARTQAIMLGLMNSMAHPHATNDPVNSAYTLADLTPFTMDGVAADWVESGSSMADTFVTMEAYDASNFVYVTSGGEQDTWSPIEDYIKELMMQKSIDWAINQQALRGQREIPYVMPDLLTIIDPWINMFHPDYADDFWADQASELTSGEGDAETGLFVDISDQWDSLFGADTSLAVN